MPDLPTLTVTAAQAQTLLAAFTGATDPTTGETLTPQQSYKRWLRDALVQYVISAKQAELTRASQATDRATLATFAADMPGTP